MIIPVWQAAGGVECITTWHVIGLVKIKHDLTIRWFFGGKIATAGISCLGGSLIPEGNEKPVASILGIKAVFPAFQLEGGKPDHLAVMDLTDDIFRFNNVALDD